MLSNLTGRDLDVSVSNAAFFKYPYDIMELLFFDIGVVLQPFIKVYGKNNEPIPAVLLSWLFVQVKLMTNLSLN